MFTPVKWVAFLLLTTVTALGLLIVFLPTPDTTIFQPRQDSERPLVIAHQGGNLESPDATLMAYDAAMAVPVEVLELDVHLSKDGELIVMHDARVDRTTNGSGEIRDLTVAEIKALDAAYWWPYHPNNDIEKEQVPENQEFPYRGQGVQVPTLEEMFQRYKDIRFVIELKDNSAELRQALLAIIDRHDLWANVMIASFYLETLQEVRRQEPRAQTYGSMEEIQLFYTMHLFHLEKLYPYDVDGFALPTAVGDTDLTKPSFIQAAKSAGKLLHYWTINDKDDMKSLLELGADGIMTDRPRLLREVIDNESQ